MEKGVVAGFLADSNSGNLELLVCLNELVVSCVPSLCGSQESAIVVFCNWPKKTVPSNSDNAEGNDQTA